MNKLSKEKRNHLILVALGTTASIAALWYCLIGSQRIKLVQIAGKSAAVQREIDKTLKVVQESHSVEAALSEVSSKLAANENQIPSGDLYAWIVTRIKQFNVPTYKVDMPQLGLPVVSEVPMFADFPYHQASVAVAGTAYYYDLGKFLADFENHFPYARIQNLSLEPSGGSATSDEKEKLSFRMEIVTLVKANNP